MRPYPQFYADLVTFTEKTLNEKLHFLCSVAFDQKATFLRYHIHADITRSLSSHLSICRKFREGL